jgi:hypothetical protein
VKISLPFNSTILCYIKQKNSKEKKKIIKKLKASTGPSCPLSDLEKSRPPSIIWATLYPTVQWTVAHYTPKKRNVTKTLTPEELLSIPLPFL